jgi:hypothetical protein
VKEAAVRFLPASTLVVVLVAGALDAQNVVPNPGFDGGVAPWTSTNAAIQLSHSTLDARGGSESGSLLVTNSAPNGLNWGTVECLPTIPVPGTTYDAGGTVRVPSGGAQGQAFVDFYLLDQPGCHGSVVGSSSYMQANGFDEWTSLALRPLTATAEAKSIAMQLTAIKNFTDARPFQAYYDDLYVVPASPRTLTVVASASIHGKNGTFFQTDLWVANRSHSRAVTVSARHICFAGQTCSGTPQAFSLQPRESRLFSNVLASLFGDAETSGAVELSWDGNVAAISASSRTYTPALPAPTYGAEVPAAASSSATTRALFLGLGANGGDLSSGFRSNAGAYNAGSSPATVTFELYDAGSRLLGTTTHVAAPGEAFQVNDVFGAAGAESAVTRNATLVVTSTAPVFPYATVIDNQSADSVFVTPSEDEAQ